MVGERMAREGAIFAKNSSSMLRQLTCATGLEADFKRREELAHRVTPNLREFPELQEKIRQYKEMMESCLVRENEGVLYISTAEELAVFNKVMTKYKDDCVGVYGAINRREEDLLKKARASPHADRIFDVTYDASGCISESGSWSDSPSLPILSRRSSNKAASLYGQDRAEEALEIVSLVCFVKRTLGVTDNALGILQLSKPGYGYQELKEIKQLMRNYLIVVQRHLLNYGYVRARCYDDIIDVWNTFYIYPTWQVKFVLHPNLYLEGEASRLGIESVLALD